MKIAVASSGLGHIARGIETWADDLGAALHRRGVDVTLFKGGGTATRPYEQVLPCWQRGSRRAKWAVAIGKRFFWRYGFGSTYQVEQETFARSLLRVLQRAEDRGHKSEVSNQRIEVSPQSSALNPHPPTFDLIHTQDPWLAYRLEQARRKGKHHAKVILAHGTEEPLEFLQQFEHVQELAPYYLEQDKRRLETLDFRPQTTDSFPLPLTPSPTAGWFAIPNFVDISRFSPDVAPLSRRELGIPENAFVILCVSAIKRHHKRVDTVIDAVARLRSQQSAVSNQPSIPISSLLPLTPFPIHLVIAGAREHETDSVIAYGKQQLGSTVTFLPNFDRSKMPGLYRLADVMMHGSLMEMMPIALLEATASGLPVVAHNWPVIEWIVGDGGTCVDATQPGAMASALTPYLLPEFRAEKSAKARHRAVAMFSEEVVVEQIVEMYRVVSGKRQEESGRRKEQGGKR